MRRRFLARLSGLAGVMALLASCAGGGSGDGVVTLDYWCWGETQKVAEFNATHPRIHVNHTDAGGGNDSATKLLTASRAHNAPDVSCVEYQTIPALIVSGVLVDVAAYTRGVANEFSPETWSLTSFEGHVYGIPQDVGPMVMLYNRARFEELGIQVPRTWKEFADVAAQVRRKDPDTYLTTFSPTEFGEMAGLAQQAGGQWWQVANREWTVGIADAPSRRVAGYWQRLISRDLVEAAPLLTPEWNNRVNRGRILTWPAGVWAPGVIYSIAKQQAGDWAIAPLPQWETGDRGVAMQGGSALAVTSSDQVEAAVEFITWMNTSKDACVQQIKEGQYPASRRGQALTAKSPPPPLAAGQENYWEVAHHAAQDALPHIQWGPNVNTATTAYTDAASEALRKGTSLVEALEKTQKAVVDEMERDGYKLGN